MRIAIITEGVSEFKSLPQLYPQLHANMPARSKIVKTLKVNAQPDAPYRRIIASCRPSLIIASQICDMLIVLLDREQQADCPGKIADVLEKEFMKIVDKPVRVALKDRMYENWLISDLHALRSHPKRFNVDGAVEKKISPNKADTVNGLALIKRMIINGEYSKIEDSDKICKAAVVERMAENSRSFRHFLHVLGHHSYKDGCRSPTKQRIAQSKKRRNP